MQYDNGVVLQNLEQDWSFLGANAMEWGAGLVMFLLVSTLGRSPAALMPYMLAAWVGTTVGLATLRHSFPDEQRGLRNAIATSLGFAPPGIPAPSKLQPTWSSSPCKELDPDSKFVILGFDEVFPSFRRELADAESLES